MKSLNKLQRVVLLVTAPFIIYGVIWILITMIQNPNIF